MGRKKRKGAQLKPFCYYCDREFDDEKVLIQHQKAKHFKCSECNRKLDTATGLVVHMLQVHKETISRVPNALNGRDNPEFIIHGTAGVPVELLAEKQQKLDSERGAVKQSKTAHTVFGMSVMSGFFNQMTAAGMPGFGNNSMLPGQVTNPILFNQLITQFASAAAANQLNTNPAITNPADKGDTSSKSATDPAATAQFTANWTLKTPSTSSLQSRIDSKLSSTLGLSKGHKLVFDYPDETISPEEILASYYGYELNSSSAVPAH